MSSKTDPVELADALIARTVEGYLARHRLTRRRRSVAIRSMAMRVASLASFLLEEAESLVASTREVADPDPADVDELRALLGAVREGLDELVDACEQTNLLELVPPKAIDLDALRRVRARVGGAMAWLQGLAACASPPSPEELEEGSRLEAEIRSVWGT